MLSCGLVASAIDDDRYRAVGRDFDAEGTEAGLLRQTNGEFDVVIVVLAGGGMRAVARRSRGPATLVPTQDPGLNPKRISARSRI
jgi:hypothetical protein